MEAYNEAGKKENVKKVFNEMLKEKVSPNEITLLVILKACEDIDQCKVLMNHFQDSYGIFPTEKILSKLISYCGDENAYTYGNHLHSYAIINKLFNIYIANTLITFYAKCGFIEESRNIFNQLKEKNIVTWSSMAKAESIFGNGNEIKLLLRQMKEKNIKPDGITYISVLTAYSHAGFIEDAIFAFEEMKGYNIEPDVYHYTCLIDAYGRAGMLKQAEEVLRDMKEPNEVSYKTLLGACRIHKDLNRALKIALEMFKKYPDDPSIYVLVANNLSFCGEREKAQYIMERMKDRDLKKTPGVSKMDIKGRIITAYANDEKLLKIAGVEEKIKKWEVEMSKMGYVPNIDWDSNINLPDDEAKLDNLCKHSEKVLLAYATITLDKDDQIRIVKNLRVCGNCHTATKLISIIENRKIIVRDSNRFHIFENGKCSCGDYF